MKTSHQRLTATTGAPFAVVHQVPGRVRLRLERPGDARALAAVFCEHPATREVRWRAAAASMTVLHDRQVDGARLVGTCASRRRPASLLVETTAAAPLRAVSLLWPAGLIGEALKLLTPAPATVMRRVQL